MYSPTDETQPDARHFDTKSFSRLPMFGSCSAIGELPDSPSTDFKTARNSCLEGLEVVIYLEVVPISLVSREIFWVHEPFDRLFESSFEASETF